MSEPMRDRIADAFWREESRYTVPAGLRRDVVRSVMDRRAAGAGPAPLLAIVSVLLAAAVIVTLIGLQHLPSEPLPGTTSGTPSPSPSPTPSPTPSMRFTEARVASPVFGQLHGMSVIFTETGLQPGQSVAYRVTGRVDLFYDCGPGGPSAPVAGPVDFSFTRPADASGTVTATVAIPPPSAVPACAPATRQPVVTGDWRDFVVEDTAAGVRVEAGGDSVAT